MRRVLVAGPVLLLAGCVKESAVAGGSRFGFELWVPGSLVLGGLAVLALAAFMVKQKQVWAGLVLGLLGLGALFVLAPGMANDRAVITDERFELDVGFWFAPTHHSIPWADVAGIEGTAQEKTGRRGRKRTEFAVVFKKKAGGSETVPVGDLMKRGPYLKLVEVATKKGIPVTGVGPEMGD